MIDRTELKRMQVINPEWLAILECLAAAYNIDLSEVSSVEVQLHKLIWWMIDQPPHLDGQDIAMHPVETRRPPVTILGGAYADFPD